MWKFFPLSKPPAPNKFQHEIISPRFTLSFNFFVLSVNFFSVVFLQSQAKHPSNQTKIFDPFSYPTASNCKRQIWHRSKLEPIPMAIQTEPVQQAWQIIVVLMLMLQQTRQRVAQIRPDHRQLTPQHRRPLWHPLFRSLNCSRSRALWTPSQV